MRRHRWRRHAAVRLGTTRRWRRGLLLAQEELMWWRTAHAAPGFMSLEVINGGFDGTNVVCSGLLQRRVRNYQGCRFGLLTWCWKWWHCCGSHWRCRRRSDEVQQGHVKRPHQACSLGAQYTVDVERRRVGQCFQDRHRRPVSVH